MALNRICPRFKHCNISFYPYPFAQKIMPSYSLGVAERGTLGKSGYTKHTCFLDAPNDFNEITAPGLYSLQNPILMSNKPPVSSNGVIGFLIVGGWDARRLIQLYVDENNMLKLVINDEAWFLINK